MIKSILKLIDAALGRDRQPPPEQPEATGLTWRERDIMERQAQALERRLRYVDLHRKAARLAAEGGRNHE